MQGFRSSSLPGSTGFSPSGFPRIVQHQVQKALVHALCTASCTNSARTDSMMRSPCSRCSAAPIRAAASVRSCSAMQAQHLAIFRRSTHINGFLHQISVPSVLDRLHDMPSKCRATFEAQEKPGGEGWLVSDQQFVCLFKQDSYAP